MSAGFTLHNVKRIQVETHHSGHTWTCISIWTEDEDETCPPNTVIMHHAPGVTKLLPEQKAAPF
jgi:hypothetical protein